MRKSKLIRVDPRFDDIIRKSAKMRIQNNIDRELRTGRELTSMILNAPSMAKVLEELQTIPKKEDLLDL